MNISEWPEPRKCAVVMIVTLFVVLAILGGVVWWVAA